MATSDVAICNMALGILGAQPITALSEGSDRANACVTWFQQAVDETLVEHPWNCATFRTSLGQIAGYTNPTVTDWGLANAFALPTNPYCLRVLGMNPDGRPYKIESLAQAGVYTGRVLLTDETVVAIIYIARLTDYSQMHPSLVKVIALHLAELLCYTLTEHQALADGLYKKYKDQLAIARSIDSQEGSVEQADITILRDVRNTNSGLNDFDRNWRIAR